MRHGVQGYSISSYGQMIIDRRMNAYLQALRQAIRQNSVLLDIGTGIGFFAVLACQYGAKKVYAIEPDNAIQVARQVVIDNGFADQIELIQNVSTLVNLPEKVDVLISDLRGNLPLFQKHIPVIVDARERFLKSDGIQIPQKDILWGALIHNPEQYQEMCVSPWEDTPHGCDIRSAQSYIKNTFWKIPVLPEHLIVEPQFLFELDYTTVVKSGFKQSLVWNITSAATSHGCAIWFDANLLDGIGFSNAPGQPDMVYGRTVFPFFKPLDLIPGDQVTITLHAHLVGNEYIWTWHTQVTCPQDPEQLKVNFKQSTFYSTPFSSQDLQSRASTHIPRLNESGHIDCLILQMMSGSNTLGDIANTLVKEFPHYFQSWRTALNYVTELAEKYG